MDTLLKHGSHDQSRHNPSGGSRGLLNNLPAQLNPVSAAVDAEFKSTTNVAAANDLARAKASLWSGTRAESTQEAATSLANARLAIGAAARKLSGTNTGAAIRLSDASQRLKAIVSGLRLPQGGN